MARILTLDDAHNLNLGHQERAWIYNTLDVTGTREVADVLLPRLDEATALTYAFERALQGPALTMALRGVRVDKFRRDKMVSELKRELRQDEKAVSKMSKITDVWDKTQLETGFCPADIGRHHKWPRGVPDAERHCEKCGAARVKIKPFQPGSSDNVMELFAEKLKVPAWVMRNKKAARSADEMVLERIGHKYPKLREITEAILSVRDKVKQLGSLQARLTPDGRYPSTFNVGAAWTGRFSSSKSPFQEGGNLQNWSERHRAALQSDPGYDMFYSDLEQAESNVVAHIANDENYIEAHRTGDPHTFVARMVWPELPWTGDLKKDKKVAAMLPPWDQKPGHSYRFQSKSVQHGTNFGRTYRAIARDMHIPEAQAERAQGTYFDAFPGIQPWMQSIEAKVRAQEPLVNPLGRTIYLFGRPWDRHTINQGLSFIPQSTVADILDLVMWRVWKEMDPEEAQLLAQVHDAILGQFPTGRLDLARKVVSLMKLPVRVGERIMTIGTEIMVGKNWGKRCTEEKLRAGSCKSLNLNGMEVLQ